MSKTSQLPVTLVAASCLLGFIGGCTEAKVTPVEAVTPVENQKAPDPLVLTLSADGEFTLEITNTTGQYFIFNRAVGLGIGLYHESANGEIVHLTDFYRNAEVGPPSPFDTVNLFAEARYILKARVNYLPSTGVDRRDMLKKKGTIYAVVHSLHTFQDKYQKDAEKVNLLKEELRSNTIKAPLNP